MTHLPVIETVSEEERLPHLRPCSRAVDYPHVFRLTSEIDAGNKGCRQKTGVSESEMVVPALLTPYNAGRQKKRREPPR